MKTVGRKLVRRDVISNVADLGPLGHQVPNEVRKFALTAHVTCSVGWLGAVAVSLTLAVAAVISPDEQLVRAVYLTMELIGCWVLVPLSLASLFTGVIQSLGTTWGLFRHYWIVAKLLINVFATVVLLLYTQTLGYLADTAKTAPLGDLGDLRNPSPVIHASAALLLLLVATAFATYKPRGRTRYGWRKLREQSTV